MPLQKKIPVDHASGKQSGTVIRFNVAGGFASFVYYIVGNALDFLSLLPVMGANPLAYVFGMVASYVSQKIWVFRGVSSHTRAVPLFLTSSLMGLAVNSLVVWILLRIRMHYSIASLVAILATAFFSYFTQRFIVFTHRR